MKKHLVLRFMLAFAVICLHNVVSAAYDSDPTGVVAYVSDDASTIAPAVEPTNIAPVVGPTNGYIFTPGQDVLAADSWQFRQPDVSYIDRYLLKLPDHDKLPTSNVWLIDVGHSIRMC